MRKSERTRAHIVAVTAALFNTRGYDGTSLAELCRATGLTKGALYGNFASKEELAEAVFRYSIERMRAHGRQFLAGAASNHQKLNALLGFFSRFVLDTPVPGGCPLLNTAVEADDHRTSMKQATAAELEKSVADIELLLNRGKKHGEFRKNFNSRRMAMRFFCSIEGAIMLSRVSSSEEAMKAVVTGVRETLDGLAVKGRRRRKSGRLAKERQNKR